MEENKRNLSAVQDEDTGRDADRPAEGEDVLKQMKRYLADSPEEMAREAGEYMAEHPDTPEAAAARRARFFARLEAEQARTAGKEAPCAVNGVIEDPLPEEEETDMPASPEPLAAEEPAGDPRTVAAGRKPFYRRRSFRIIAAVAACLVVLVSIPMVSQSARTAVQSVIINIFGSGASGFTYDKTTMQPYSDEELAWNEVAEKLGVERLEFDEVPRGLQYNRCDIDANAMRADLLYEQNGNSIHVNVEKQISADMNSAGIDVDQEMAGEVEVPSIGQLTRIFRGETEGEVKYYASIVHKNAVYTIEYYDDLDAMKEFISHIYFY